MSEKSVIEDIIEAAAKHGRESEPDHEVGDLQDLLRVAWKIMEPRQRIRFWNHDTTTELLKEWGGM
ncbi:hypothetical protein HAP48_0042975 [Bradyrhizobium septentrionale]|uniref:Uncharacterized protein n=1 Tax=Bradyrhizobium septentrionale TaxID=1404411 RepID=A0A973W2X6_9BRAD|nr:MULTISPECIES: hypothetical protein [Bradyrhizobium]MCK7671469.1 hypothetical protein [Bradyrhizobium sp. 2S1]UGY15222.1 hypothetical protein HAP48_0042975 [Bradyrhizobium septentrionale]